MVRTGQAATGRGTDTEKGIQRLARLLGWVSVGLGAVLLGGTREVVRRAGLDDSARAPVVARLVGARELVSAAGLLGGSSATGWIWSRVLGDAMDLTVLGRALRGRRGERRRRTQAATAAIAAITVVDVAAAVRASAAARKRETLQARAAVTVNRPVEEVYQFWRSVENLPRFMAHLESVQQTGARQSHWVATAPAGKSVQWDAEIVRDVPGKLIAWRSVDGADVDNSGTVRFAPAPRDQGTEVRVELDYVLPGGKAGKAVAKLFGEAPDQQVSDDLRRFKQVLETGDVVRTEGSPEGTKASRLLTQRPAQPQAPTSSRRKEAL